MPVFYRRSCSCSGYHPLTRSLSLTCDARTRFSHHIMEAVGLRSSVAAICGFSGSTRPDFHHNRGPSEFVFDILMSSSRALPQCVALDLCRHLRRSYRNSPWHLLETLVTNKNQLVLTGDLNPHEGPGMLMGRASKDMHQQIQSGCFVPIPTEAAYIDLVITLNRSHLTCEPPIHLRPRSHDIQQPTSLHSTSLVTGCITLYTFLNGKACCRRFKPKRCVLLSKRLISALLR